MRPLLLVLPILLVACQDGAPSTAEDGSSPAPVPPSLTEGVWLKGDLHLHSHHSSDATSPLPVLIRAAEAVGMDYFIATDHDNHVEGDVAGHTWADPDYRSDSMLMLYGAEWTTHRGHGNTISASPYDHQSFYDIRDALDTEIGAVAERLGFHLSACHPAGGDAWSFSYDFADGLEVWNSAIWSTNSGAMVVWDDLLKSGRRLTGRGGSDAHHGPTGGDPSAWTYNTLQGFANYIGTPTTWVYARERSAAAVVEALDAGRVAVSANPNAERVELRADTDGDGEMDRMMGDDAVADGQPVTFRVDLVGGTQGLLPLYQVRVVKDGAEFGSFPVVGRSLEFTDTPVAGQRSYYRVEVSGLPSAYFMAPLSSLLSTGTIGLSNPIYFGFHPRG
ncbi:MAG: histidinol-phosphatase [Nevskiaceae bacterium]|nr:MAG: histidinol-phosphatase [Nevskiaceae bacterium]